MRRAHPERLVTRFALGSLVAFLAIGGALSVALSRQFRARGEAEARSYAEFVTDSILRYRLSPKDLAAPMLPTGPTADRYASLAAFVDERIREPATAGHFTVVRVKIWTSDGTVLFSDEPRLVGRNFGVEDDLREAFAGMTVA